jgi:hypothetical protein
VRLAALRRNIPCPTTRAAAHALLDALAVRDPLSVRPLQDYLAAR